MHARSPGTIILRAKILPVAEQEVTPRPKVLLIQSKLPNLQDTMLLLILTHMQ